MEKTLKFKNPENENRSTSRRPDIVRVLIACMLGALLASIAVGKWARPQMPKPALLGERPLPKKFTTTPNNPQKQNRKKLHSPTQAETAVAENDSHQPKYLACRLEMSARRMNFRAEKLFPTCTRAFSSEAGCGSLKKEFLEALYLYAYALAEDSPNSARHLLGEAIPMLRECDSSLPLRTRALELNRQLESRRLAQAGRGMQGLRNRRPPNIR